MFRTPFAIMMFMSLASGSALAQTNANEPNAPDAATDATTHMDKQLGNEQMPQDKTLSNAEVRRLQNQQQSGAGTQEQTTGATVTTTPSANPVPSDKTDSGAMGR